MTEVKKLENCNLTTNGDNAHQHSVVHEFEGKLLGTKDLPSIEVSQLNADPSNDPSATPPARTNLSTKPPCTTECTSPSTSAVVTEDTMSAKNDAEGNHSASPTLVCKDVLDKVSPPFTHHMSLQGLPLEKKIGAIVDTNAHLPSVMGCF